VGGQKTQGDKGFDVARKVKTKKFYKRRFLDFVLNFFKTPHPNPLPTSGERR
jgi:hypothetical protein